MHQWRGAGAVARTCHRFARRLAVHAGKPDADLGAFRRRADRDAVAALEVAVDRDDTDRQQAGATTASGAWCLPSAATAPASTTTAAACRRLARIQRRRASGTDVAASKQVARAPEASAASGAGSRPDATITAAPAAVASRAASTLLRMPPVPCALLESPFSETLPFWEGLL